MIDVVKYRQHKGLRLRSTPVKARFRNGSRARHGKVHFTREPIMRLSVRMAQRLWVSDLFLEARHPDIHRAKHPVLACHEPVLVSVSGMQIEFEAVQVTALDGGEIVLWQGVRRFAALESGNHPVPPPADARYNGLFSDGLIVRQHSVPL